MMRRSLAILALLILGMGTLCPAAMAGKKDDNLQYAFSRETDFVDRIHTDSVESVMISNAIYDSLLYSNPDTGKISGALAKSWTWVDDLTVDFDLRQGVRFHNGEEFDADDVIATVGYVTDLNNKFRQQQSDFGWIKSARKVEKYKVRLSLNRPFPLAEQILAGRLIVWPNEYTAKNGHEIHASKPIGTGPYKMGELQTNRRIVLKTYPDYFEGPKPKASIGTITIRFIPEIQTQVAEMLAGGLDLIQNITDDQAKNLSQNPNLQVIYGGTDRFTWLSMDAAGRSAQTPLKNLKVRQAIAHAIHREAIVKNLVGGVAKPIVSQCNVDQFLCSQDVTRYPYDPPRAKRLLTEAGYPDGFQITLLVGDPTLRSIGEAIQEDLRTIGIRAKFETYTLPAWRKMFLEGQSNMSVLGWGSGGINDVHMALPTFFDLGPGDYAQDKQVAEGIKQGGSIMKQEDRRKLYDGVLKRIAEQAYTVPLYSNSINYIVSKEVEFTPARNETWTLNRARWR